MAKVAAVAKNQDDPPKAPESIEAEYEQQIDPTGNLARWLGDLSATVIAQQGLKDVQYIYLDQEGGKVTLKIGHKIPPPEAA